MTDDFICAVCQHPVSMTWNRRGPDEIIPPLCRWCEGHYGRRDWRMDGAGTFRDRRIVRQGLALAEALASHASVKEWEGRHAAP